MQKIRLGDQFQACCYFFKKAQSKVKASGQHFSFKMFYQTTTWRYNKKKLYNSMLIWRCDQILRIPDQLPQHILCMIFQEKCFSSYILLTGQMSLSHCLYFLRYWVICVVIICFPVCDTINFKINYSFLFKPFFYMTKNVETNISNIFKTKRTFNMK